jgi:hypothetical protein
MPVDGAEANATATLLLEIVAVKVELVTTSVPRLTVVVPL